MKKIVITIIFILLTTAMYSQTLTVSPTAFAFNGNNVINTNSPVTVVALTGATLTGPFPTNITVTAPAGFLISKSNFSGFTSSLTVQVDSATLASTKIYVVFAPATSTSFSDTVRLSGAGAPQAKVAVSGDRKSVV
jgi:hypothetical protein